MAIRGSGEADFAVMLAIINDAARAYRGVIPVDRWHEPYMPADELAREIAAGVVFGVVGTRSFAMWTVEVVTVMDGDRQVGVAGQALARPVVVRADTQVFLRQASRPSECTFFHGRGAEV